MDIARSVRLSEVVTRVSQHFGALTIDSADALVIRDQQMPYLISSPPNPRRATVHRDFSTAVSRRIQPLFLAFLVALDSLRFALSIDASLEDRSDELRNPEGLSYHTTEEGLSDAFSQCGQVIEATIVMDRVSDRSKGFGFVSYASENEAEKAITEMSGKALNGRTIFVDYAKPRSVRGGGMPIARGPPETTLDS
ncbi:glycine-rich RNA-binding protein 4, mitochondrial [Dorcoceras hygrometricum]|uniref:Glycine-rich RNA-binding protein 4, mitochondrial n=1 Tax=Dorcoceras hygrometricum TaxID=472368 RepID=A0A2Z7B9G9_9LAMI|nr:glycine-rich RNA-binding protein 4, mitochondrial [Dorcoceras hygrometricum]